MPAYIMAQPEAPCNGICNRLAASASRPPGAGATKDRRRRLGYRVAGPRPLSDDIEIEPYPPPIASAQARRRRPSSSEEDVRNLAHAEWLALLLNRGAADCNTRRQTRLRCPAASQSSLDRRLPRACCVSRSAAGATGRVSAIFIFKMVSGTASAFFRQAMLGLSAPQHRRGWPTSVRFTAPFFGSMALTNIRFGETHITWRAPAARPR
jgi:hypothetical protein